MDDSSRKRKLATIVGLTILLFLAAIVLLFFLGGSSGSDSTTVRLPKSASMQQELVTLPNGLEVLLLSDPSADVSAASAAVGAGSMREHIQGLAHFVEHLLFISSDRHPEEGLFMKLVAENGGSTNAYTAGEETVFFFSAKQDAFNLTLDVFSGFFTCPNFPASRVQDEIKAVNSEHQKNILNDGWRKYRLTQVLADPAHPYSKFATGNTQTLASVPHLDSVARKFKEDFYVAENLKLVLYGNHSLSDLAHWAKSLFSSVPSAPVPERPSRVPLYPETGKLILTPGISTGHSLLLTWALPPQYDRLQYQSLNFILYLLTSPGGLKQRLMTEGLASELQGEAMQVSLDVSLFQIEVTLTDYGFLHWETCLSMIEDYVNALAVGSKSEHFSAFSHFSTRNLISFDYEFDMTAMEIALTVSGNMLHFPIRDFFGGFALQTEFDFAEVTANLEMITRENAIGILMSSEWEADANFTYREEFYDIPYEVVDMPKKTQGSADVVPLWPTEASVDEREIRTKSCPQCGESTVLIRNTTSLLLWFAYEARYSRPIAQLSLLLPVFPSLTNSVLGRLYQTQISLLLETKMSQWDIGASVGSEWTSAGLALHIRAINSLLANVTSAVLDLLPPVTNPHFSTIYERVHTELQSEATKMPVERAMAVLKRLIISNRYLDSESEKALQKVTLGELLRFQKEIVQKGTMRAIVVGDITSAQTEEIALSLEKWTLRTAESYPSDRVRSISGSFAYQEVLDPSATHAVVNWYSLLPASPFAAAATLILESLIHNAAFDELRNKQQLGYVVRATINRKFAEYGLIVYVQGSYQPPHVMDSRIGAFLREFEERLRTMEEGELENVRKTVVQRLRKGAENLQERISELWEHVTDQSYRFEEDREIAELALKVDRKDLIAIMEEANSGKRTVSVQMYQTGSEIQPAEGRQLVKDLDQFE